MLFGAPLLGVGGHCVVCSCTQQWVRGRVRSSTGTTAVIVSVMPAGDTEGGALVSVSLVSKHEADTE